MDIRAGLADWPENITKCVFRFLPRDRPKVETGFFRAILIPTCFRVVTVPTSLEGYPMLYI
jgi:hypothetical protein